MDKHTHEALQILAEEAGEIVVAVSKCMRFGLDQVKYGHDETNRQHLAAECGDLLALLEILVERGQLDGAEIQAAAARKREKLHRWSTLFEDNNNERE